MKWIKYLFNGSAVEMGWNEANEALAQQEADNGEYTIVDDGLPANSTVEDILNAMLGVTE